MEEEKKTTKDEAQNLLERLKKRSQAKQQNTEIINDTTKEQINTDSQKDTEVTNPIQSQETKIESELEKVAESKELTKEKTESVVEEPNFEDFDQIEKEMANMDFIANLGMDQIPVTDNSSLPSEIPQNEIKSEEL